MRWCGYLYPPSLIPNSPVPLFRSHHKGTGLDRGAMFVGDHLSSAHVLLAMRPLFLTPASQNESSWRSVYWLKKAFVLHLAFVIVLPLDALILICTRR